MLTSSNNFQRQVRFRNFNRLRNDLQFSLNCIDFADISAIFLASNDNLLKMHNFI